MKEIFGKLVCETLDEVLDPSRCAVLPIDMQNDFISPDGVCAKAGGNIAPMQALLPKVIDFLGQSRKLDVPIVHIRIADLPDGASDSPAWLRSKGLMANTPLFAVEGTWGAEFCEGCEPLPGELVVTKRRSSAFVGTELDQLLKSNGIQTVVIIGEQTPGCVEATFRDAAYYDFYNVLVEDCIAAREQELHDASVLIQKARHDVVTMDQVLSIWHAHRGLSAAKPDPVRAAVPQLA